MRPLLVAYAVSLACSSSSPAGKNGAAKDLAPHKLTVFLTTELRGTIEPCGCNSDPLGDLARTSRLINDARHAGRVLYFDGGSTLYSSPKISDRTRAQERLKADLLADSLSRHLEVAATGLGPYDLAEGGEHVRLPRSAANVPASAGIALEPPKVLDEGGIKIGVFGLVSAAALRPFGIEAADPAQTASEVVSDLRKRGAQAVVTLAHMTREEAQALAKATPGIDFVLVSQNAPEPKATRSEPDHVGNTWLFGPANRGQVVSRLDLYVRGEGHFVDAIGDSRAQAELERIDEARAALKTDLGKWQADPSADKAFVASKQRELEALEARRAALVAKPLQAPDSGNYFTLSQVRIAKRLPCLAEVNSAKMAYDKAAGEANLAANGKKPEPPAKGTPGYVGMEECSMCHKEAVEFWRKTKHAAAWDTLEVVYKQFNYDCIGCHVTGFDKPGGSNLAFNEPLRDVQCETCHGPGSIHVEADGNDQPRTIVRKPAITVCQDCHNEEHSDTFDFEPYLRDVTGPGHGEAFRKSLGEGKTGQQLRSAALEAAGKEIGEGCGK